MEGASCFSLMPCSRMRATSMSIASSACSTWSGSATMDVWLGTAVAVLLLSDLTITGMLTIRQQVLHTLTVTL